MRMYRKYALFTGILICSNAAAETSLNEDARIVRELCRGGDSDGRNYELQVDGEGKVEAIVLKRFMDAGLGGRIELSEQEWAGLRPLVGDPESYVECVREFRELILRHVKPSDSSAIALDTARQVRVDVNPYIVAYASQIDDVAIAFISSKMAQNTEAQPGKIEQFRQSLVVVTSKLGKQRQEILSARERMLAIDVPEERVAARTRFVAALDQLKESMEIAEVSIRQVVAALATREASSGGHADAFLDSLSRAINEKASALTKIEWADAQFSASDKDWPMLSDE